MRVLDALLIDILLALSLFAFTVAWGLDLLTLTYSSFCLYFLLIFYNFIVKFLVILKIFQAGPRNKRNTGLIKIQESNNIKYMKNPWNNWSIWNIAFPPSPLPLSDKRSHVSSSHKCVPTWVVYICLGCSEINLELRIESFAIFMFLFPINLGIFKAETRGDGVKGYIYEPLVLFDRIRIIYPISKITHWLPSYAILSVPHNMQNENIDEGRS